MEKTEIAVNPDIPKGALYAFYKRNGICEAGFGPDMAEVVLKHPCVSVGAFQKGELVGFARALFDGLSASIVEFSLDLRFQDANELRNGCFVESDPHGIAKCMGKALLGELRNRGCYFFSISVWTPGEQEFYEALGFCENKGAREFVIDERPYVKKRSDPAKDSGRRGAPHYCGMKRERYRR
ncbi:MAG: hypothetical protein ABSE73_13700 [Planctomycetota bacterium]